MKPFPTVLVVCTGAWAMASLHENVSVGGNKMEGITLTDYLGGGGGAEYSPTFL